MARNQMFAYLTVAAVVAAVLIAVGAPLASLLPFAVLLGCPLMMVLMTRRMSKATPNKDHVDQDGRDRERQASTRRAR